MIWKEIFLVWAIFTIAWGFHIEKYVQLLNNHTDICAKAINQQQYQLDVITEYIKGQK